MTQAVKLSRRAALLMPLALGGCGMFDWLSDEAKAPIKGNREPVLSPARGLQIDAAMGVELPPVLANPSWAMPGGDLAHSGGNLAGGLTQLWTASIGDGGDYRTRLTAQPLIVGSQVFSMDSNGEVAAFDLNSGRQQWSTPTKPENNRSTNIGGGIGFQNGQIFAATGRAEFICIDARTGAIVWRKPIPSPARSGPSLDGNAAYFCTIDQKLVGASTQDGSILWTYQASEVDAGVLAQAAPAVSAGLVIAGFESGDLAAVRAESGSLAWSDNLGTLKGSSSLLEFSSLRGAPVIDNGIVYAIGLGGLMAALDVRSGRRIWERDIAGANTPWLAGDTLYVITTEQRVAALAKDDGTVHWVIDLPRFTNPKRTKGLIDWTGPALIAGKLLAVSTDQHMAVMDPVDGKLVSLTEITANGSVSPVAAQGTVLVLTDDATLTAYR